MVNLFITGRYIYKSACILCINLSTKRNVTEFVEKFIFSATPVCTVIYTNNLVIDILFIFLSLKQDQKFGMM
ncbi:hypothetical protein CUU64_04240 [Bacillus sp. V5-8f]|nr:hypothetical protein CUU64_04240 [Bacillus sp. V5-8f]